jgi:hypothetical protein
MRALRSEIQWCAIFPWLGKTYTGGCKATTAGACSRVGTRIAIYYFRRVPPRMATVTEDQPDGEGSPPDKDVQREGRRFIATRTGSAERSSLPLRFFLVPVQIGASTTDLQGD